MKIAYLTTDEVNEDLALQMADECGVTLYPLTFTDGPTEGRFDAVLYDWDSLPQQRREEILLEALTGSSSYPVAVHGYGLEEEEVKTLHQDGVAVFHRLEPEVFRVLRRLAGRKERVPHGRRQRRRELALSCH